MEVVYPVVWMDTKINKGGIYMERKIEIRVSESQLTLIIRSMIAYGFSGLVEKLELKEKLQELKRYNYPKEKSL